MDNKWKTMSAGSIPSKDSLHPSFIDCISKHAKSNFSQYLLDIGCGRGEISKYLFENYKYRLICVDVNEEAIKQCDQILSESVSRYPSTSNESLFKTIACDLASLKLDVNIDIILCQLVISIIGTLQDRINLLTTCYNHLKNNDSENSFLLLSVSGDSSSINESYAKLYAQDEPDTHEKRTYYSRNDQGEILYTTHHFQETEIKDLIETCGFHIQSFIIEKEVSSRRKDQAAYFYYIICSIKK